MARLGRLGTLVSALLAGAASSAARADVVTDGTLGRKVRLSGPDVEVGADLGRVRGRNLFHSFERFGVPSRGRVTLTGPPGLDNVVSRVTGGEPSSIDGTLASRVPGADVYLVNPAGVVFGPGARLDVPGSFHASTADELRFGDGVAFSASDPGRGGLSVARPEAFGFLGGGGRPGAIAVDRGVLAVPAGEALSLVGGDVTVDGGATGSSTPGAPPASGTGVLHAPAGRVALTSLGGAGTAGVAGGAAAGDVSGRVRLTGGTLVTTQGDGGGAVLVRGGALTMDAGSFILALNTGDADARDGVTVRAGRVSLTEGPAIVALSLGGGRAGRVDVEAGDLRLAAAGGIGSSASGPGDAGDVTVRAGRLVADGTGGVAGILTGVASNALPGSAGAAGTVTVVVAGTLELRGTAQVSSSAFGSGRAGTVAVDAGRLVVVGDGSPVPTGIGSATYGPGAGGTVLARAGEVELRRGGVVSSSTFGAGDAGTVAVRARRLLVSGDGSPGPTGIGSTVQAGPGPGGSPPVAGTGAAGSVTVEAGTVEVRDGGVISSSANTPGGGAAGDVAVRASRLLLVGEGGEVSSSGLGLGPAGDVAVAAGEVRVDGGAVRTVGAGAEGGRIDVAADRLAVLRGAEVTSSGVEPAAGASLITLRAPLVVLLDGSRVVSLTGEGAPLAGSGEARVLGDLTFVSGDSEVLGSSTVELAGVDNTVGTGLQVSPGAFLDAGALLGQACAAGRAGEASTFARAGRKGGLPPSPDRPLPSAGSPGRDDRAASAGGRRLLVAGTALSAGCDGRPLAGAM